MKQQYLFDSIPNDKYDLLSKEEVVQLNKDNENLIRQMKDHIDQLHSKYLVSEQKSFLLEEQTINIKHRLFGKSSEKSDKKIYSG